ncbi:MAG: hypothetical protein ACLQGP_16600 [Isosphaeraceae bacterium]
MTVIRSRNRPRRGLTAVAVLVCLIILTMVAGAVLKVDLARRQQLRAQEHQLQAEWLAEAGIQRGLARFDADPAYTGETWEIPARELDSPDSALVTIVVGRVPGDAKHQAIRAQADYPRDSTRRARCTRTLAVDLQPGGGPAGDAKNH